MKVLVLYLAFSDTISVVEEDELDHLIAASKGQKSRLTIQTLLTWMRMRLIFSQCQVRVEFIAQKFSVLLCSFLPCPLAESSFCYFLFIYFVFTSWCFWVVSFFSSKSGVYEIRNPLTTCPLLDGLPFLLHFSESYVLYIMSSVFIILSRGYTNIISISSSQKQKSESL